MLTAEEQTITSALFKSSSQKRLDSLVRPVRGPKRTREIGEFLKTCDKGDHFVSYPKIISNKIL